MRLTRTDGTSVVINAAMVSGIFHHNLGRVTCTCLRTIDGNEWLVREPIEYLEAAIEAANNGKPQPKAPAPMAIETKAKEKAKK